MRATHLVKYLSYFSLVSGRVLEPPEIIKRLAQLTPWQAPYDNNITAEGIEITFSGCEGINAKTGNYLWWDVNQAWDQAIMLTQSLGRIDLDSDIGAFDFFGPGVQTDGKRGEIERVYFNIGGFGRSFWWGWRVNIFCEPEDVNLLRWCASNGGGAYAYEYDTICKDGKCPCETRDEHGNCNGKGDKGFVRDPDKSYINIVLCDTFFAQPSLNDVIETGKNGDNNVKYNLNTYWHNRAKTLFHEIIHGSTVGKKVNGDLDITDIYIKIKKYEKKDDGSYEEVYKWVQAYGALNAKILARTIGDYNYDWVRSNDDNWTAYALAKYVQSKVGVYPILPLADGRAYSKSLGKPPDAMFLIGDDENWMINDDLYEAEMTVNAAFEESSAALNELQEYKNFENLTLRLDSDYPEFYIAYLKDARAGNFRGNDPPPETPPVPTTAPPPPPPPFEYEDHCSDSVVYSSFDYTHAKNDIEDFCRGGVDLLVPAAPLWTTYDHTGDDINMKLQIGVQWSQREAGQSGCNPSQDSDHIDEGTCNTQLMRAMNSCNTDTITKKYGQYPMTWNSPGGCIDFWLVGHGADWSCDSLGVKPKECTGKQKEFGLVIGFPLPPRN